MAVTVECSRRLLDGDVSIVDTRRLFLKYSDGSSPAQKNFTTVLQPSNFTEFYERVNTNEGISETTTIKRAGSTRFSLNESTLSESVLSDT